MAYEEPPGTYIHIADVGKLHSRVNNLRRTRKEMREPPAPPVFDPNHRVPERWINLAQDLGIPDRAHELPVLLEAALDMRDPMLIGLFKKIFAYAKLGDPVLLRKHRADMAPRRERFLREDAAYQKRLRTFEAEKSSRARHEVEYLKQLNTSWKNLCNSLSAALIKHEHNPARLQENDRKFVDVLKRRGYVDVNNHTVAVRFGTLANLDSETIAEITWALLSSLRGKDEDGLDVQP